MGPQSGSCGYVNEYVRRRRRRKLQWVHSLVAVVILDFIFKTDTTEEASMGPQSGSCGYLQLLHRTLERG